MASATLPGAPLSITVDASDVPICAVLQQQWQPLSFFQALSSHQSRYDAFGREFLAAYPAVKHFCPYVEAKVFHNLTDYKPLTFTRGTAAIPSRRATPGLHFSFHDRYISHSGHGQPAHRYSIEGDRVCSNPCRWRSGLPSVSREQRQDTSMAQLRAIEGSDFS